MYNRVALDYVILLHKSAPCNPDGWCNPHEFGLSTILCLLGSYHILWNHKAFYGHFSFYRPQRSCGKVMFLHMSVILSTGCWGCLVDTPPPGRHPPGRHLLADTPGRQLLQQTVRILLECILVLTIIGAHLSIANRTIKYSATSFTRPTFSQYFWPWNYDNYASEG